MDLTKTLTVTGRDLASGTAEAALRPHGWPDRAAPYHLGCCVLVHSLLFGAGFEITICDRDVTSGAGDAKVVFPKLSATVPERLTQ